eukprot:scaffold242621_cov30-Tisochrysis_lutea.AAC.4
MPMQMGGLPSTACSVDSLMRESIGFSGAYGFSFLLPDVMILAECTEAWGPMPAARECCAGGLCATCTTWLLAPGRLDIYCGVDAEVVPAPPPSKSDGAGAVSS